MYKNEILIIKGQLAFKILQYNVWISFKIKCSVNLHWASLAKAAFRSRVHPNVFVFTYLIEDKNIDLQSVSLTILTLIHCNLNAH